jgi:glycosyltransferase involved in cell wall biosynthesis
MKIILPVHHFLPRHSAGAELYTYRLARWLQQNGHDVSVVAFHAIDAGAPDVLDARLDVYEGIPVWRLSMDLMRAPERKLWTFYNPLLGDWFHALYQRERPDLVHFQAGYLLGVAPILAARDAGVRVGLTLHDYWYLCPRHTFLRGDDALCEAVPQDPKTCVWCYDYLWHGRHRKLNARSGGVYGRLMRAGIPDREIDLMRERRRLTHAALQVPAFVIGLSRFLTERFTGSVPAGRLHTIRTGLDLSPYIPIRSQPRAQGGPLRIGYAGQIASHKGVHLLVEAFERLQMRSQPLALDIYGGVPDDAYGEALRACAARDRRITLHGRFENAHASTILHGLDLLAVPSTWYENMPLTILEAYAAGTPVITAGTGGMAEAVTHDVNGLHFRLGDASDLTRQLQRLVNAPELLRRLQAGAHANCPASTDVELTQVSTLYAQTLAVRSLTNAQS